MSSVQIIREVAGHSVSLPNDMWGIIDRIQRGDATCGWSGDESFFVTFRKSDGQYRIWQHCLDGMDRLVMSVPYNEFDQRVLFKLAAGDTRYNDPFAAVDRHNDSLERDQQRELEAMAEEMADVLKYYHRRNP